MGAGTTGRGVARLMPYLRPGLDEAIYLQCTDPDCPAKVEGTEHAHVTHVERGLVDMGAPPPIGNDGSGPPEDYVG
jgi:hypothetical protein